MEEKNKKSKLWNMRTNSKDQADISRLAHCLRVSESDAVRLAVTHLLRSGETPQLPARMRLPRSIRRKVTG